MFSARLAAAIGGVLIFLHLYLMIHSLRAAKQNLVVTEKMRRLASIVIQNFPDRQGLSDEVFWKVIRRPGDPMLDSWGGAYRLESRGRDFYWRSSGSDRIFGTQDDLEVKVPFVEGPAPDLGPPDGFTGFPAIDAK